MRGEGPGSGVRGYVEHSVIAYPGAKESGDYAECMVKQNLPLTGCYCARGSGMWHASVACLDFFDWETWDLDPGVRVKAALDKLELDNAVATAGRGCVSL